MKELFFLSTQRPQWWLWGARLIGLCYPSGSFKRSRNVAQGKTIEQGSLNHHIVYDWTRESKCCIGSNFKFWNSIIGIIQRLLKVNLVNLPTWSYLHPSPSKIHRYRGNTPHSRQSMLDRCSTSTASHTTNIVSIDDWFFTFRLLIISLRLDNFSYLNPSSVAHIFQACYP